MRILVTGAAGYLGSILVPKLLRHHHSVVALDNFMYAQSALLDCCHLSGLKVVRGDVRDYSLVERCLRTVDAIFPLACITGAPACHKDPVAARTINRDAVVALLRMRSKQQLIIYPTTNSGYGVGEKDKHCTEETPLRPISLYGKLKVETEQKVVEAGNAISFRFATLFGASPRMRLDLLVNDFVYRAVVDRCVVLFEAHFRRNFLHVRDAARAFAHGLANRTLLMGASCNAGLTDANLSKWQLCEEICKQHPFYFVESPIGSDPDKRDCIVSNAKIEATGFKPLYSLQQGIAELITASRILSRRQYSNA